MVEGAWNCEKCPLVPMKMTTRSLPTGTPTPYNDVIFSFRGQI